MKFPFFCENTCFLRKIGGYQAERKENKRWIRMERKKITDSVNGNFLFKINRFFNSNSII